MVSMLSGWFICHWSIHIGLRPMLMTVGAPALAELQKKFKEQDVPANKQAEFCRCNGAARGRCGRELQDVLRQA